MPARAALPATRPIAPARWVSAPRALISRISLLCAWWMKMPAERNSSALKPAWVVRWKKPAAVLPAASAISM